MTATTLPLTFAKQFKNTSDSLYDEFGAHSIPPVASGGNSWDEEVVPALRKRLEEESVRLDKRMSHLDGYRGVSDSRQNSRPIPRLDRNNEIIQDGLGSDDLIPSEWATGSSAQFAKIGPRARTRNDEMSRSASAVHYTSPPLPHYQSPTTLGPPSPLSRSGSSQASPSFQEPPSPTTEGALSKAREMARRLAKERERTDLEESISMGFQDSDNQQMYQWQADGDIDEDGNRIHDKDSQRVRTLSTPNIYRPDTTTSRTKYPPSSSRSREHAVMTRSTSKTSLRDENTPVSKIPLPVSGSMSKLHAHSGIQKSKSTDRLNIVRTPPHQDNVEDEEDGSMRFGGSNRTPDGKRRLQAKRTPYQLQQQKMEYSPPTQDVFDEFGPLGGTPTSRSKRGKWEEGNEVGNRSVSESRNVSNPWDEEMLPVVKKRLEQQRMLEEMSRDDGFVDTWDRNGMPLSRSPIQIKQQRAREERSGGVSGVEQPYPVEELKDEKGRVMADEESLQRMKRLQEQLDLGISGNQGTPELGKRDVKMEMQEMKSKSSRQQVPPTPPPHSPTAHDMISKPSDDAAPVNKKKRTNGAAAAATINDGKGVPKDDDGDNAGCCKCIIM